jgi:coproporphyrinogen III oxidase-like Fe-S oxidoreductase
LSDVYAAIDAVTAAGLPSWSLDLISGLPGLKLAGWQHSLEQAVAAGPNHISVYDLQVPILMFDLKACRRAVSGVDDDRSASLAVWNILSDVLSLLRSCCGRLAADT